MPIRDFISLSFPLVAVSLLIFLVHGSQEKNLRTVVLRWLTFCVYVPQPLPEKVVGATSGPVLTGAKLFRDKGCLNCHLIDRYGGRRGPDLTYVGDRLAESDIVIRIVNGGVNMPAFGKSLSPEDLAQITAFLQSRKRPMPIELQARER